MLDYFTCQKIQMDTVHERPILALLTPSTMEFASVHSTIVESCDDCSCVWTTSYSSAPGVSDGAVQDDSHAMPELPFSLEELDASSSSSALSAESVADHLEHHKVVSRALPQCIQVYTPTLTVSMLCKQEHVVELNAALEVVSGAYPHLATLSPRQLVQALNSDASHALDSLDTSLRQRLLRAASSCANHELVWRCNACAVGVSVTWVAHTARHRMTQEHDDARH